MKRPREKQTVEQIRAQSHWSLLAAISCIVTIVSYLFSLRIPMIEVYLVMVGSFIVTIVSLAMVIRLR